MSEFPKITNRPIEEIQKSIEAEKKKWSTQAVRSISKPPPTPTRIRRLSLLKSLIRCRKSDNSGIAERQQTRAICFRAWCSVLQITVLPAGSFRCHFFLAIWVILC